MTSPTRRAIRSLFDSGALDLPDPGTGSTPTRFYELSDLARHRPIGVARLAEAHTDAVAILHEAGRDPAPRALYGVWASQTTTQGVTYDADDGTIDGAMGFASGLGIVDRALVTATTDDGVVLIDVDLADDSCSIITNITQWASPALIDTATGAIAFRRHRVGSSDIVGGRGWYSARVGFWHGSCAPAACWAGGACGLIDSAARFVDDNPHQRAHHGALLAQEWALSSLVREAGIQIDLEPHSVHVAERVGRSLRFAVSGICRDVMDRFGRAFGPRPHVQDAEIAQRVIDLDLYIKQHHGERELPAIADLGGGQR